MRIGQTLKVRRKLWRRSNGSTEPHIVIYMGTSFVLIPFDIARQVVDRVHDLCDDHERGRQVH